MSDYDSYAENNDNTSLTSCGNCELGIIIYKSFCVKWNCKIQNFEKLLVVYFIQFDAY